MENSAPPNTSVASFEKWNDRWLPRPWVMRLQAKMLAMYGARFASQFQGEASLTEWRETWAAGLASLSGLEISAGLERCLEESPEFAPTLGAFREMCLRVVHPSHKPAALLATPRATSEIAEDNLRKIRELLHESRIHP